MIANAGTLIRLLMGMLAGRTAGPVAAIGAAQDEGHPPGRPDCHHVFRLMLQAGRDITFLVRPRRASCAP